jgi:hypothetical protein
MGFVSLIGFWTAGSAFLISGRGPLEKNDVIFADPAPFSAPWSKVQTKSIV